MNYSQLYFASSNYSNNVKSSLKKIKGNTSLQGNSDLILLFSLQFLHIFYQDLTAICPITCVKQLSILPIHINKYTQIVYKYSSF